MMNKKIVKLYATEFVSFLNKKKSDLDVLSKDINEVVGILTSNNIIQKYLKSPVVENREKIELIQNFTQNAEISALVKLLCERSRLEYAVDVMQEIVSIIKSKNNIKIALVTSVVLLSIKHKEKIQTLIKKLFNYDAEIQNIISKSIIGGLTIQVDDNFLDLSLKKQFDLMEQQISL
jgi:F-type H+-transporting ATPase subunit delta